MTWYLKGGFAGLATVAAVGSMVWSAPARAGDGCSAQVNRVERALNSGRKIDPSQLKTLQGCLLSDPAIADSLAHGSGSGIASAQAAEAAAVVVASFQNQFL